MRPQGDPPLADVLKEQQSHLVGGEKDVLLPIPHGDAHPVAVRIGGQKQIAAILFCILYTQLHGLPNLRVGVGAGGEIAVRLLLLRHHMDVGESVLPQSAEHALQASPI